MAVKVLLFWEGRHNVVQWPGEYRENPLDAI